MSATVSTAHRALRQSFFLPSPPLTEHNAPSQSGRVHIVTGGYTGCGLELAKLLYGLDATVFIAGRSASKAETALDAVRASKPDAKGHVAFMQVDLADLASVRAAVEAFEKSELSKGGTLHVLTNNAGVMFPPQGSTSAQGRELQIATNCTGPLLLTELLVPALRRGAADDASKGRAEGGVRVTWAGSLACDLLSPKGGISFDDGAAADKEGEAGIPPPKTLGPRGDYGQSKVGNLFLASECARRDGWGREQGVRHYCWNPGNLRTELQRHSPRARVAIMNQFLHPAKYGAYTELYSALSPDLDDAAKSGSFIVPWGRVGEFRPDLLTEIAAAREAKGNADRFFRWCLQETAPFAGAARTSSNGTAAAATTVAASTVV